MDVFYYWKNYEADLKAGRIGYLKCTPDKAKELAEGYPDFLWITKTPPGRKGELQLLAKLKWADKAPVKVKPEPGSVFIYYDAHHPGSVVYTQSGTDTAIADVTRWVGGHFPKMAAANFQGHNGQESLRGAALGELQRIATGFAPEPFLPPVEKEA